MKGANFKSIADDNPTPETREKHREVAVTEMRKILDKGKGSFAFAFTDNGKIEHGVLVQTEGTEGFLLVKLLEETIKAIKTAMLQSVVRVIGKRGEEKDEGKSSEDNK